MLNIKRFVVNPLQENCYVVSDETKECVIIDCGAYYPEEGESIIRYINENDLRPVHLLQTHGHLDHCCGNDFIFNAFGLKPEVHLNDQPIMDNLEKMSQLIYGTPLKEGLPPVGKYFTEQDKISFGSHTFDILETPGHSRGSVFFICPEEQVAFSGDTLFRGSIGRTDFDGGSMFQIIQSLRMVCQLDDTLKVYPGHGHDTSIGYECAHNMYLDR